MSLSINNECGKAGENEKKAAHGAVGCESGAAHAFYKKYVKRCFDIILSGLGIVIFALPMLIIKLIIKKEDPGHAVFVQKRSGLNKRPFNIYKFRTMKMTAPANVPTRDFTDYDRYTLHCGRALRKLSLDELPQLFNIFRGEMSFVGPRPVILEEQDLINERDKYGANAVLPGLTGLAQISGRDEVDFVTKARLDGDYAKGLSFLLDVKILLGTVKKVLKGEGVRG